MLGHVLRQFSNAAFITYNSCRFQHDAYCITGKEEGEGVVYASTPSSAAFCSPASSILIFFISSSTSASASFSCASSVDAEALPLTPWFAAAGLLPRSLLRSSFAVEDPVASASSFSISFSAFAMFCTSCQYADVINVHTAKLLTSLVFLSWSFFHSASFAFSFSTTLGTSS